MNFFKTNRNISKYVLISIFSFGLLLSYYAANNVLPIKSWATPSNPFQISNDQVKDNYLVYIKEKANKGPNSDCQAGIGVGVLQGDDIICNPGLENLQEKAGLDDEIVGKLSQDIDKDKQVLADKFEKLREDGKSNL